MKMRFRIDEEGFIRLLRRDIYNRDDVYLRELLQNAIDARAAHVEVRMHTADSNEVTALSCCDNGLGMTKEAIADQFLNLCKRHSPEDSNMFRRFGVGVFTYLAFCREVHVCTKAHGGKAWYLRVGSNEVIQSLNDLSVDDLVESHRENVGTTVLLLLRRPSGVRSMVASFQYWIKAQLPATVAVFASASVPARADTIPSLADKAPATDFRQYDVTPTNPPPMAHVLREIRGLSSGYVRVGGRTDGLALCEGGILIESDVPELVPKALFEIPFSGVVNMLPGCLDLDAGRSRVRRESLVFNQLKRSLSSRFSEALANHIKRGRYRLTEGNFTEAQILRQALSVSEDPAKLLKECEESVVLRVVGHGEMPLQRLATLDRSSAIYCYSGDSWYWIVSMGDLKGHDTQLHVTMKSNAGVVSASGSVVFILPKEKADGEIIDKQSLKAYFSRFYSKRLQDVSAYSSPAGGGKAFPIHWQSKVSVPATLSIAVTSVPGTLFFDSGGNALVSRNDRVIRAIDGYLAQTEEVPTSVKCIIESYLYLLSGKMPGAVSKAEAAVMSAIRPTERTRRTNIRELMDEIEQL